MPLRHDRPDASRKSVLDRLKLRTTNSSPQKIHSKAEPEGVESWYRPLPLLFRCLSRDPAISGAALAHPATIYSQAKLKDLTWGCGYRNIQHLLSVLLDIDHSEYEHAFGIASILTLKEIQTSIERAWSQGYDVEGAEQLKWSLVNKRKWIGTTEAYALFTSCGYDCSILQFTGTDRSRKLIAFCEQYFGLSAATQAGQVSQTQKLPLYFQHQGHSRTIVGVTRTLESTCLLVHDPARRLKGSTRIALQTDDAQVVPASTLRGFVVQACDLKQKEYQILLLTGERLTVANQLQRKIIRPRDM